MMRLVSRIALAIALLLPTVSAYAQFPGQLPSGSVFGNAGAVRAPAAPASISAMLDRALCSTLNSTPLRGASTWGCQATRVRLLGPLTLYVNGSTGSDSNTGLTAGSPFLTPNKAYITVCNNYDLAGATVLIDLSDAGAFTGTYAAPNTICGYVGYSSANGQATVVVQGAAARSTTCVNYPTTSGGITGVSNGFPWTFKNLQINGQTSVDAGTFIAFDGNCFGATSGPHIGAVNAGSKAEFINNPYTINGSATGGHIQGGFLGEIIYQASASPVTIIGTPSMGGQFVTLSYGASLNCQDITFTGALAASTKRYVIDTSSSIQCGKTSVSSDPNTVLPGDTTGTGLGVSGQLLSSNGPGGGGSYNNIAAFLAASPPLNLSGATVGTFGCPTCVLISGTAHGDSNYAIASTDRYVYTNAAFTAPRTWTLPAANSLTAGATIWVQDAQGTVTTTNTLTINRAGADTINVGGTSLVITSAGGGITFTTDGVSNWGVPVQTVTTGGTGRQTLTNHGVVVGAGTNPVTQLAVGASGALLLGVTGADPAFAAMSQDCTITNAGVMTCTGINGVNQNAAWTAFTPSLSCGTGTFTVNSAKSKTLGKTTFAQIDFTISAIGTCTTPVTFTLPNTPNSSGSLSGQEQAVGFGIGVCTIAAASTTATCKHGGGTSFVNAERFIMSGVYENQ